MSKDEIAARDQARALAILLEWVADLTERPVKEIQREVRTRVRERQVYIDKGQLYICYPRPYWTKERAEKHRLDSRAKGDLDFGPLRDLAGCEVEEAHTKDAWVWCGGPFLRNQPWHRSRLNIDIDVIVQFLDNESEP